MTAGLLKYSKPIAGLAIFAVLGACSSDLTGNNRQPVKLSFTTNPGGLAASNGAAANVLVGPANELELTKVQLVVSKLELDRSGTAACISEVEDANDDHPHGEGEECEDVSRDPLLVDLNLDDALHTAIIVPLAAGTFSELEARIAPARDKFTAFNAANPNLVGNSVRVEGSFKGEPFVFTAPVRSRVEMEFDPPLVIDQTTTNATISLDVRKWFLTASGDVIDPRPASLTEASLAQINTNIRRSFHAFEDDNERGEDHHEGHHGNDDGSHH